MKIHLLLLIYQIFVQLKIQVQTYLIQKFLSFSSRSLNQLNYGLGMLINQFTGFDVIFKNLIQITCL